MKRNSAEAKRDWTKAIRAAVRASEASTMVWVAVLSSRGMSSGFAAASVVFASAGRLSARSGYGAEIRS